MKHYFHFLFSAALLLGSLIVFNNQKIERPGQLKERPQIEHIALQAEAPVRDGNETLFKAIRNSPGIAGDFSSSKIRQSIIQDFNAHQVCLKRQVQIHRDLKPRIARLAGPFPLHRSNNDDPPLS